MSRAIDKELAERLKEGNLPAVYGDVSRLLDPCPDDGLLEIEVLDSSHPVEDGTNFLREGNAIAIPKLRLVQAFFVARNVLHSQDSPMRIATSCISSSLRETAIRRATGVILLMDPEYLTAANARKRVLLHTLSRSHLRQSLPDDEARLSFRREMLFLDSLLTSHLHRHTKSPTLWSHRRWLFETFMSRGIPAPDLVADMKRVIFVAASRHPRNYYAWSYARWLADTLLPPPSGPLDVRLRLGEEVVTAVKEWCLRNHSDTSGWSFLYFIATALWPHSNVLTAIFEDTLRMASSFRWTNESVWVFLRTASASGMVNQREGAAFREAIMTLKQCMLPADGAPFLDAAMQWSTDYHVSPPCEASFS